MYRTKEEGEAGKVGYEIWEYGEREEPIHFSAGSGDPQSVIEAMDAAGCSVAVITNFHDLPRPDVPARDDLVAFNRWLLDLAKSEPRFYPLVAVDPSTMSVADNVAHLEAMVGDGAKGIKIHPPVQHLELGDRSIWPLFDACIGLDLAVVSHSGPSRDGSGRGTPESFRPLLEARPRLRIVLAHMGGQSWRQLPVIARDFPSVMFDLCEIVEWLGASRAPTRDDFVALIREVGPDRVMMGSDFPWYDIDHTVELVMGLPGLSSDEKAAIVGENAARFFGLAV
jgi:predicted TIM-barrel fold metal-dependent hydrolase